MADAAASWAAGILLVSALVISAFYRRRARRQKGMIARTQEPTRLIVLRLSVSIPLLGVLLSSIVMPWGTAGIPAPLRLAGFAMGAISLPGLIWMFRSIGANISETVLVKAEHELVTHGPYRWVRHPLYSLAILLLLSIGLMLDSLPLLIITGLVVLMIVFVVVPKEEDALVERFGAAYRSYAARTGMLTPRLRPSA